MNVSLVTSVPVVPPWDQGDKNLAISLVHALPDTCFGIITTRDATGLLESNIEQVRLYHTHFPSLWNKLGVYSWLTLQTTRLNSRHHLEGSSPDVPDLYHYIYQPSWLSSMLLKAIPGIHKMPSLHTVTATATGKPLEAKLFFARHIVTLSEYGRRSLVQAGLINVTRIGPGIHVNKWASLSGQEKAFKARLGLEGHPTILFPGHYGPGQGADIMLEALPKLVDKLPNVRAIFACRLRTSSDNAQENLVQLAAKRMGLGKIIKFYNTVNDMHTLIGAADITVLPLENMHNKIDLPTTLIETLAAAKPIVISDLAPMNELFNKSLETGNCISSINNNIGFAVPTGDADSLADSMLELLVQPDLRARMGVDGQALVRQNFDIHDVAKQYERLYNELRS
jgi:spore coat protein SA